MATTVTLDAARELDAADPLRRFRERFHQPRRGMGGEVIYFLGNSLGLQPLEAEREVTRNLEVWRDYAVDGHFRGPSPWLEYHRGCVELVAGIVGASPERVTLMNAVTVNLHLMLSSFYRPHGERTKVIIGPKPFPSDLYAVHSHLGVRGIPAAEIAAPDERSSGLSIAEQIEELLDRNRGRVALVVLDGVNYYSGELVDLARVTRAAHAAGARVGFDLSHAAGNVPLDLDSFEPDFAVWCSYKYLNGGPGAVAGCYVSERAAASNPPRLGGWWSLALAERFMMGPEFLPAPHAAGWQISNPPILTLSPLRASLEIFASAGIDALRAKSIALTGFLEQALRAACGPGLELLTPSDPARRGCQLSLVLPGGKTTFKRLLDRGCIGDWREPEVVRFAPVPLYNTFEECFRAARLVAELA